MSISLPNLVMYSYLTVGFIFNTAFDKHVFLAAVKRNLLHSLSLSAPLTELSHCQRSLKCRGEGAGLTFAKECGEIIMKGLTGERKRWPVLINRRRDTPKVSHSQTHKGVLHQSRTWNGIWEE